MSRPSDGHAVLTPAAVGALREDAAVPAETAPLRGRRLTLAVLLIVFAINFMDRQIVAILLEPIKRELALSDAQLGLLYGFAFAVVYSTVGIPIARWADRKSRVGIITGSLVVFSLMTMLCGLAAGYWQLVAARIGVAVGEGGTNPPSHSIIADLYPVSRRSTAMAVFAVGPHLGILFGFLVGGWVGQVWGWRTAFFVAGAAGLLFAAVIPRLVREPPRGHADGGVVRPDALPPMRAVLASLWRHPSMRHLFAGVAVWSIAAYAIVGWLPAFLIRSHGLSTSAAGSFLALVLGVAGAAGTLLGGLVADRLGRTDPTWRLRVVGVAGLVAIPFWALALLETRMAVALALIVVPGALVGFYLGPSFAMVQSLVGPKMRAVAAALLLLVLNLVGLGLGPLAVGVASDVLAATHGADSLRMALLVIVPLYLWSAVHYYAASRTIAADLGRVGRPE